MAQKISLLQHQVKVLDDVSSYKMAFETIQTGIPYGVCFWISKKCQW